MKHKLRIAYYIWETFTAGGLQRITIDKCNYLAGLGHEILLITSSQKGKAPFWAIDSRVKQVDLSIDYQTATGIANPLKRYWELSRIRREHKRLLDEALSAFTADICVNTVFCEEGSIFPELKDGSKKILESHGVKYSLFPEFERKGKFAFLQRLWDKWRRKKYEDMPNHYDHFVVLSASHLEQWQGYKHISAIPNMCSLEAEQEASLDTPVVSILARLSEEKNISSLIRIWSLLGEEARDWQLQIWGEGSERSLLETQISELGLQHSVRLMGETDDVRQVYLASSVICLTSKHEGFPMTLIEAQSFGLPIISYDCPLGPKDIITHDSNGFLIYPGDEESFASSLKHLIESTEERRRLGKRAKLSSLAYKPHEIVRQWLDLFNQLLQNDTAR